jgi:tetratricopeptide (TPR) repeat protein
MKGQIGASGPKVDAPGAAEGNHRLDSWKEIAFFFARDERTVKRWEKERGLPVHRLPGGSRARVFAYKEELERWMRSTPPEAAIEESGSSDLPPGDDEAIALPPVAAQGEESQGRRWPWLLAGCVLLAGLAWLLWWRHPAARFAVSPQVKASVHAVNPEAEELYLSGRYYWNRRTPADLNKAVDLFTQAIVRDPNYAQAYVGLADCYNLLREFSAMKDQDAYPRALAAAKKAVELDDNSAEAHASLGFVTYYWGWDPVRAEAEFRRAIALDPYYVAAHHWYATFLMATGRFEDSAREFDAAQKLDPASTAILADKGLLLECERRYDESEALLKQIESSQPDFFSAHWYLSWLYFDKKDYPSYLAEARQAALLSHDARKLAIVRAAERGFREHGEQGLLEGELAAQKKLWAAGEVPAFQVAQTAALLGRKEEAFEYLRKAYERHDPSFPTIVTDHALAGLRQEPEFQNLLAEAQLSGAP